jgi:preprotein translocase subunit SecF
LGKKWWFAGISAAAFAVGVIGYIMHGGLTYGIDFTGGTIVFIKFQQTPDSNRIRQALASDSATPPLIQRYDLASKNTVQVRLQTDKDAEGDGIESARERVVAALRRAFDSEHAGGRMADFNDFSLGLEALGKFLLEADPDNLKAQSKTSGEIEEYYRNVAKSMLDYRNEDREGLVASLDDLKGAAGVSASAVESLKKNYYAGPFALKGFESIGAVVGSDLRRRALLAVGLSFLAMLVYIAFRFKPIYGVAAIIALVHDVTITLGLFAVTQKEISLTVIAALLTLVGYSVNDTIVIFDRVRENLRLMRKESLFQILNLSINQTLSRTIMTSGFTFLAVFSLFLFGGEVLNGFSFALTIGIIVGSYSTIALASTIVEWWYRSVEQKSGRKTA